MRLIDADKLVESLTRKSVKEEMFGFHESTCLINRVIDEIKDMPTCDIEKEVDTDRDNDDFCR